MARAVTDDASHMRNAAEAADETKERVSSSSLALIETTKQMEQVSAQVQNAREVVDRLNDRTEAISDVINTIQGISDQTNLLALNAVIEAARAGETGRGFAVVADEVRGLAQNTQNETQQIANIIRGLQEEAVAAKNTLNQSAANVKVLAESATAMSSSLHQSMNQVEEVSRLTLDAAASSETQSHVAKEISTVTEGSSSNERLMSEIRVSSVKMADLAVTLEESVSQFTLKRS
ncbi:hypothetical protein GV054_02380 [Marinomonas mediterranea]|uniref:methyl-accepting chemotaxis protein n=1 Tax=Marinomonas mediterranea TaxID=119864 RepID=UPI00234B11E4|nr:methyl-accepting chemotaxis protein [Marinomonas mediterranea]WCN11946.1 hypothetical protein GV054_02380 [Marinomonas mediterranea]